MTEPPASAARRLVLPLLCAMVTLLAGLLPGARAASGAGENTVGTGYVETVHYQPRTRELSISGWVGSYRPNVFPVGVRILAGDEQIYSGRMTAQLIREDVAKSTGRDNWLSSGFQVSARVPQNLGSGTHPLRVEIALGDGSMLPLHSAPEAATLTVPAASPPRPGRLAIMLLVLAVVIPLVAAGVSINRSPPERNRFSAVCPQPPIPVPVACAAILAFLLLLAGGWTGSSLQLLLRDNPLTTHSDTHLLGRPQPIRSDEWEVFTPMALAQFNHQPRFPVVNHNIGSDGQNMLIVGMSGMPVAHMASVARPAVWGFFLFDLKRALAWYWWMPFWGCFAALWLLLGRWFALDWRWSALLAASVSGSAYSVVFSGWPTCLLFFGASGLLAIDTALLTRRRLTGLLAGAVAGWAAAGYVLVLYPGWQVALAWLLAPLALARFWQQRHNIRLAGPAQLLALLAAAAVCCVILLPWLRDAQDAIHAIRNTVYPGQRVLDSGGYVESWFFEKGLLAPIALDRISPLMTPSDAGSFIFLLLPVIVAVVWQTWVRRKLDARVLALLLALGVMLCFMFIGFSARAAQLTLWSFVSAYRLDIVLGLLQTFLLAWLLSLPAPGSPGSRPLPAWPALVVAALTALAAILQLQKLPPALMDWFPPGFILASCLALGAAAFLLLRQKVLPFLALYVLWAAASTLPFNPMGQATSTVALKPELAFLADSKNTPQRVTVIGERSWAMLLPAAGVPVVNSVLYHPPLQFWSRLDPQGLQYEVYNRYQRLFIDLADLPDAPEGFHISSPRAEEVRIEVDPVRFDFRTLGAPRVIANTRDAQQLADNGSLVLEKSGDDWSVFHLK